MDKALLSAAATSLRTMLILSRILVGHAADQAGAECASGHVSFTAQHDL